MFIFSFGIIITNSNFQISLLGNSFYYSFISTIFTTNKFNSFSRVKSIMSPRSPRIPKKSGNFISSLLFILLVRTYVYFLSVLCCKEIVSVNKDVSTNNYNIIVIYVYQLISLYRNNMWYHSEVYDMIVVTTYRTILYYVYYVP